MLHDNATLHERQNVPGFLGLPTHLITPKGVISRLITREAMRACTPGSQKKQPGVPVGKRGRAAPWTGISDPIRKYFNRSIASPALPWSHIQLSDRGIGADYRL